MRFGTTMRCWSLVDRICRRHAMAQMTGAAAVYTCPMHSDVREAGPGQCPKCGMDLLPEGTRFALLRHMISSPMHLAVMGALMIVLMAAAMMMMG
jgi:hypothetical protein